MPLHARQHSNVSCAKTAEPIKTPFGLWSLVAAESLYYMRAHWHYLANTS